MLSVKNRMISLKKPEFGLKIPIFGLLGGKGGFCGMNAAVSIALVGENQHGC
jgi:hypothetical protein